MIMSNRKFRASWAFLGNTNITNISSVAPHKEKQYSVVLEEYPPDKRELSILDIIEDINITRKIIDDIKVDLDTNHNKISGTDTLIMSPDLVDSLPRLATYRAIEIYDNPLSEIKLRQSIDVCNILDQQCADLLQLIRLTNDIAVNTKYITVRRKILTGRDGQLSETRIYYLTNTFIEDALWCSACNVLLIAPGEKLAHTVGIWCRINTIKNEMVGKKWEVLEEKDGDDDLDVMDAVMNSKNIPYEMIPTGYEMYTPSWVKHAIDTWNNSNGYAGLTLGDFLEKIAYVKE